MSTPPPEAPGADRRGGAVVIAWKAECFRSTQTASLFNADLLLMAPQRKGLGGWAPVRGLVLAVKTLGALARRRPRTVIVLNQPAPLPAAAWVFSRLTRSRLILDSHSKVYGDDYPRLLQLFYRWISRKAWVSINHNARDQAKVESWGGRSVLLEALPLTSPVPCEWRAGPDPYIFCVCSFAWDEPTRVLLEAARRTPELTFRVTGRPPEDLLRGGAPANVRFTGFLPTAEYYAQFCAAAAVATFSTRDWIMQMAVEEALQYAVPVVTNRSPVLEEVLGDAGEFVDLEASEMAEGFRRVFAHREERGAAMVRARERQRARVLDAVSKLS